MARCTGQNTRRRTSGRSGIRQPWRQARAESRFMPLSCDSLQLVPNTPRRANSNRTRLNLLSQAMNVDLDRVCRDFFAPSEHYLRHAVLAHKSTSAADEDLQQREFTAGRVESCCLRCPWRGESRPERERGSPKRPPARRRNHRFHGQGQLRVLPGSAKARETRSASVWLWF